MSAAGFSGRLASFAARYDQTTLVKSVFFGMLAGVVITLALDYRELATANRDVLLPGERTLPVLPSLPGFTREEAQPPFPVTTPPEQLREPMQMSLLPDGILLLTGTIADGTYDAFTQKLGEVGSYVETVALDSPGGLLEDALAISTDIRANGFDTLVREGALCASACPLILAGGITRTVEDGGNVGLHQIYTAPGAIASTAEAMSGAQATTARIVRHLEEMDIDPALWTLALETPPQGLRFLTPEEMAAFALVGGE